MSGLGLHTLAVQESSPSAGDSPVLPSPRLVSAAHEFEAAMMKELMDPLEKGHGLTGDGEDEDNSSSALSSFAGEAMGKAISEHGGFGIAKSILNQLAPGNHHFGKPAVPQQLNGNDTFSPVK